MAKKNQAYPRFTHDRIDTHPILGKVKVFTFKKYPSPDDDGCQTSFFRNNAEVDNPKQFGFKMFNTSIEALAAYQRQSLAAHEGLAPPVGKMIRWIIQDTNRGRTVNRWGYETALADTTPAARVEATILGCPRLTNEYAAYVRNHGLKQGSAASMESFLNFMEGDADADGRYFSQFSAISCTNIAGSLRMRLMSISLVGTQYDNITAIYDDGEKWSDNPRLRLGQTVTERDEYYMSNDMHRGNLGLWRGEPVVIDFGYHIAVPEYRDYDNVVTNYSYNYNVDSATRAERCEAWANN